MSHSTLEDRLDHLDLFARLGRALDEHRFDDLRALMTTDVTAQTPGGQAAGVDAVSAQATRNHAVFTRMQHRFTDLVVDLAGDAAHVRANAHIELFAGQEAAPTVEIGAVYRVETRRTPAGWRIARLVVTPVWRSGEAVLPAAS